MEDDLVVVSGCLEEEGPMSKMRKLAKAGWR
jgi:hypothetical protein